MIIHEGGLFQRNLQSIMYPNFSVSLIAARVIGGSCYLLIQNVVLMQKIRNKPQITQKHAATQV